jgi:hypothetical protein
MSIVAKPGCSEELVAVLKEIVEWANHPHPARILCPRIGESDLFVVESEYESLAEMEKLTEERWARPEGIAFVKRMDELRTGHYTQEVWSVVD